MSYKKYSLSDLVIENLFNIRGLLGNPYNIAYELARRQRNVSSREFGQVLKRMHSRGLLAITKKNDQKFVQLTKQGQLEALILKSKLEKQKVWDGKWRLFIFDIPESSKHKRNMLRNLLKQNNFFKLQASVYISPFSLNRQAINYLNASGLRDYIRILRVDEIDSDKELLKKFHLN